MSFYDDIEKPTGSDGTRAMAWISVLSSSQLNEPFDVTVPSVNITQAMVDFNQCRSANYLAMAYRDARDVVLQFNLGQRVVNSSQKQTLVDLVSYLKRDKNIVNGC